MILNTMLLQKKIVCEDLGIQISDTNNLRPRLKPMRQQNPIQGTI